MSVQHTSPRLDAQKDLQIYKELIEQELKKSDSEIDTDAIDRWVDEALQLQGVEFHIGEQTSKAEIQQILARFASSEQKKAPEKPRRRIKKTVLGVLAAAFLLAAFSLTAYGFWGPSETFVQNIRQFLRLERGEKLTTSEGDYYFDNHMKQYDSLEEFTKVENISILSPEKIPLIQKNGISLYYDGALDAHTIRCRYSNGVNIEVYLTNAPYPKDVMDKQDDLEKIQLGERTYYVIDHTTSLSFVLFDGDYVYVMTSSSKDALIDTAKQLK